MDNVAFDFYDYSGFVDSVGSDGDSLGESTCVVGVVADANLAGLAGHNGLLGPFRSGAAAAGTDAAEDEGLVAGVGEGEDTVAIAALLDGAVIVFALSENNLRTVLGLGKT